MPWAGEAYSQNNSPLLRDWLRPCSGPFKQPGWAKRKKKKKKKRNAY